MESSRFFGFIVWLFEIFMVKLYLVYIFNDSSSDAGKKRFRFVTVIRLGGTAREGREDAQTSDTEVYNMFQQISILQKYAKQKR